MPHVKKRLEESWSSSPITEMFNSNSGCWGKAYSYKCSNMQIDLLEEIFSLCSNQEERDAGFILYVNHAKMIGFKNTVICSPDKDVFFILLCHACNVYWDTRTGRKRQLINVSKKTNNLGKNGAKSWLDFIYLLGKTVSKLSKVKVKSHL